MKTRMLKNINKILKEKNMTMQELSDKSGISIETIKNYEKQLPSIDKIQRIGEILGKSCFYLINGYDLPENAAIISSDNGIEIITKEKNKELFDLLKKMELMKK